MENWGCVQGAGGAGGMPKPAPGRAAQCQRAHPPPVQLHPAGPLLLQTCAHRMARQVTTLCINPLCSNCAIKAAVIPEQL